MTTKYDFKAWLNTKPDDEKYDYFNNCGDCAVGQFMKSRDEAWEYPRYTEIAREIFGHHLVSLINSRTFGELKKAPELADA